MLPCPRVTPASWCLASAHSLPRLPCPSSGVRISVGLPEPGALRMSPGRDTHCSGAWLPQALPPRHTPLRGPPHDPVGLCSPPPLCCLLKGLHCHAACVGFDVPVSSTGDTLQAPPSAPDPRACPSGVPRPYPLTGYNPEGLALGTADLESSLTQLDNSNSESFFPGRLPGSDLGCLSLPPGYQPTPGLSANLC